MPTRLTPTVATVLAVLAAGCRELPTFVTDPPSFDRRATFEDRDAAQWPATEHPLGRGRVLRRLVGHGNSRLLLRVEPESFRGSEVRSARRFGPGRFEARLRLSRAAGALAGFFLYEDAAGPTHDEIDVELPADGGRRILFTVWDDGERVHSAEDSLPFDPAAGFHRYELLWDRRGVAFLVDGRLRHWWAGDAPDDPMHLYLNHWWPSWTTGRDDDPERGVLEVDWIRWSARSP